MIINTDLSRLFNIDLEGKSIGAVSYVQRCSPYYQQYAKSLRGDKWQTYFNAGVLLFDIEKTVKENITDRSLEYLFSHKNDKGEFFEDQDALNAVCLDNVKLLDRRWLILVRVKKMPPQLDNSFILHYNQKPWYSYVPADDIWWNFAARTPFYRRIIEKNRQSIIHHKIKVQTAYLLISLLRLLHLDNWAKRYIPMLTLPMLFERVSALKNMAAFEHLMNPVDASVK
jgi:lipopolysaccharide biosynthesis glycosyltransferase